MAYEPTEKDWKSYEHWSDQQAAKRLSIADLEEILTEKIATEICDECGEVHTDCGGPETPGYEIVIDRGIPTHELARTEQELKEKLIIEREKFLQLTDDDTANYHIEVYKGVENITHLIDFETGNLGGCGNDEEHPLRAHCKVHGERT